MEKGSNLFRPREYLRTKTIAEATNLLKKYGNSAAALAGGTDLIVTKPPRVKYIIDISRLPLNYMKSNEKGLSIGALTTLAELEYSKSLKEPNDVLTKTAYEMGTPVSKFIGTIGGNICNAAPSADMPPPLIALDAEARIVGTLGKRKVVLEKFFTGPKRTCLRRGELLAEIFVPRPSRKTKIAFAKKGRTREDIAQVNVAVRITLGEDGACKVARIVLGAVAPTPIRAKRAECMLEGLTLGDIIRNAENVAQIASEETKPISDIRSSADYRKEISKVLVKRAIVCVAENFRSV